MANPVASFMTPLHFLARTSRVLRPVQIPSAPRRRPMQNKWGQADATVTYITLNRRIRTDKIYVASRTEPQSGALAANARPRLANGLEVEAISRESSLRQVARFPNRSRFAR